MKTRTVLLLMGVLPAAALTFVAGRVLPRTPEENPRTTTLQTKTVPDAYHLGPWEQRIGYSQGVRAGHVLYISGTVGADAQGQPADLDAQMKKVYTNIQKTLAHYNSDFSHVIMEHIYTTDMEALIQSQETRKQFYGESLPAATWVQVQRLYGSADKIEIEVQVAVD